MLSVPLIDCAHYFLSENQQAVHMSAVLHALVAMTTTEFQLRPNFPTVGTEEAALQVTSYPCQWKQPKKRKESNLPMSDVVFEKHTYGNTRKRKSKVAEDFDSLPLEYRGTTKDRLPFLLDKLQGKELCISLLQYPVNCQRMPS